MISSQAPSIIHAIPRHGKQNAHPSRFSIRRLHIHSKQRKVDCHWAVWLQTGMWAVVLSQLCCRQLQTLQMLSGWVQLITGMGACCMREDPALEAEAHVVLDVTGKNPQQSSKADHGFRVWFRNSTWSNPRLQWKANGLCLPPAPAASAAPTVAEVPPAWPPVLCPGRTMKCSSAVPAHWSHSGLCNS